jgi:HTH-type transcriptional regulator/antitoxin HigA
VSSSGSCRASRIKKESDKAKPAKPPKNPASSPNQTSHLEITRRHQTGIWLAKIDRLIDAPDGSPEAEYLDVLSTLVEAYEEQHYPIPLPDPIEYILYYMESRGLTHQELEPYLGSRRQVADVLNKTQPLSMKMIRKLQHGLDMAGEILIQPYNLLQSQEPVRLLFEPAFS